MSALRPQRSSLSTNARIAFAFVAGILVGRILLHPTASTKKGPLHGSVKRLEDTPVRPTSHVDQHGKPITKQQLLEPFVVPHFVGVSVATFTAGQELTPHEHENLHEFFHVLEGSAQIEIDGRQHKMEPGTFFHLAPHERHGIQIPGDGSMKMAVFGVTV
jgi:quercetin dioxygenase-like cupin family protein